MFYEKDRRKGRLIVSVLFSSYEYSTLQLTHLQQIQDTRKVLKRIKDKMFWLVRLNGRSFHEGFIFCGVT